MDTKKSEIVKGRRNMNHLGVMAIIEGMTKPLTRVEISRLVDQHFAREGDGVSWNDTGTSLATLVKDGVLQETKVGEKKRTFYTKVTPQE